MSTSKKVLKETLIARIQKTIDSGNVGDALDLSSIYKNITSNSDAHHTDGTLETDRAELVETQMDLLTDLETLKQRNIQLRDAISIAIDAIGSSRDSNLLSTLTLLRDVL